MNAALTVERVVARRSEIRLPPMVARIRSRPHRQRRLPHNASAYRKRNLDGSGHEATSVADHLLDEMQRGTGDENGGGHPPVDRSGRRYLPAVVDGGAASALIIG